LWPHTLGLRMESEALEIALKHVSETKNLLENLLTSSESFDYLAAKKALALLQKKTKQLGRLEAKLRSSRAEAEDRIELVDFRRTTLRAPSR
jgi:hypothetical protein